MKRDWQWAVKRKGAGYTTHHEWDRSTALWWKRGRSPWRDLSVVKIRIVEIQPKRGGRWTPREGK